MSVKITVLKYTHTIASALKNVLDKPEFKNGKVQSLDNGQVLLVYPMTDQL